MAAALAAVTVCVVAPGEARAVYPGSNGAIAYTLTEDGEQSIHLVNADGSGDREIAGSPATLPEWSPDGSRLVYVRDTSQATEIVVANSDGSDPRTVKALPPYESRPSPSFAPNGREILYTDTAADIPSLRLIGIDGARERAVLSARNDGYFGTARFSPDGDRIVFPGVPDGRPPGPGKSPGGIWTVNKRGKDRDRLVRGSEFGPEYSPDGRRILFGRLAYKFTTLWMMKADGRDRRQIGGEAEFGGASWAPDGDRLIATSLGPIMGMSPSCSDLYVTSPSGKRQSAVTSNCGRPYGSPERHAGAPAWQPLPKG